MSRSVVRISSICCFTVLRTYSLYEKARNRGVGARFGEVLRDFHWFSVVSIAFEWLLAPLPRLLGDGLVQDRLAIALGVHEAHEDGDDVAAELQEALGEGGRRDQAAALLRAVHPRPSGGRVGL